MMERFEEMNRMREHVMNEVDVDKDGMISMAEFLRSTKSEEFKNNEPWQVVTMMMMMIIIMTMMVMVKSLLLITMARLSSLRFVIW